MSAFSNQVIIFSLNYILYYYNNNSISKIVHSIGHPLVINSYKNNNLLPMPCVSTIRRHLLAVKSQCGFDHSFFKLLKKKFKNKTHTQKKGILLIDELFLCTSFDVNSRTLTYSNLENFGIMLKVLNWLIMVLSSCGKVQLTM